MDAQGFPHIAVNVIAPDASVKRVAFGVVGGEGADLTAYITRQILKHGQEMLMFYQAKAWRI
jgi:hypothetical protein